MPPDFVTDSVLWGLVFAAAMTGAGILLGGMVLKGSSLVLTHRTDPDPFDDRIPLDILLLGTLKGPVAFFVLVLGLLLAFMSIVATFDTLSAAEDWTRRIWVAAIIVVVTYLVSHVIHFTLSWYIRSYSARTGTHLDDLLLPPLRRILPWVIYSIGGVLALNNLGVSISPILAGMGIGGLAVALAVQPTLSNLFAGAYLMAEKEFNEGDYVKLEGGPSGYVVNVGWRSTKIKTFYNTLVIIPNSKLSDTIITNYFHPGGGMFIMLTGGVSYENNLAHVREVVVDEIQKLVDESPYSVKDYKPWFGESNVEFWIYYESNDLMGSFYLTSDGIERLHARFLAEGIKRNYPVREILYPPANDGMLPADARDLYPRQRSGGS